MPPLAPTGAKLAQEVVENELMKGTAAYRDGRIVYLAHPAVWYTAEGGITALDRMLRDLEDPPAEVNTAERTGMSAAHPGPLPFRLRNASGSCSVCLNWLFIHYTILITNI